MLDINVRCFVLKCHNISTIICTYSNSLVWKKELFVKTEGDFDFIFLPPDVEKRDNPVCHFVTPLDGSMDLDIHRPAEVKIEKYDHYVVYKQHIM